MTGSCKSAGALAFSALVAFACAATVAQAQGKPSDYPKRPIRIVIGIAPETVKALAADGSEPAAPATPEEFKAKFAADYDKLAKLIKAANIRIN